MAEDNNKIGATITYDSQHALDAARKYKEQIAAQLGHKLASRPYTPAEQRRNAIGTKLLAATEGKDGANESNKSSKNVDEQKSATFDPWVNQLLDYEPYNYIISLSCVSPAQFNFGSQFHGGELILKSGGWAK